VFAIELGLLVISDVGVYTAWYIYVAQRYERESFRSWILKACPNGLNRAMSDSS